MKIEPELFIMLAWGASKFSFCCLPLLYRWQEGFLSSVWSQSLGHSWAGVGLDLSLSAFLAMQQVDSSTKNSQTELIIFKSTSAMLINSCRLAGTGLDPLLWAHTSLYNFKFPLHEFIFHVYKIIEVWSVVCVQIWFYCALKYLLGKLERLVALTVMQ